MAEKTLGTFGTNVPRPERPSSPIPYPLSPIGGFATFCGHISLYLIEKSEHTFKYTLNLKWRAFGLIHKGTHFILLQRLTRYHRDTRPVHRRYPSGTYTERLAGVFGCNQFLRQTLWEISWPSWRWTDIPAGFALENSWHRLFFGIIEFSN